MDRRVIQSAVLWEKLVTRRSLTLCRDCLHKTRSIKRISSPGLRDYSTATAQRGPWGAAVAAVQSSLSDILPGTQNQDEININPLKLVGKELKFLSKNIRQLLGSGHPVLDTVARYYTQSGGKHVRPMLVLLMSRAVAKAPRAPRPQSTAQRDPGIDDPLSPLRVLSDDNPNQLSSRVRNDPAIEFDYNAPAETSILPSQRRLAEITELIHIASLMHDDVIDNSSVRRTHPSVNAHFGNKMAVLAGDFLLGRASVALARLRDPEVTELLATVIANIIEGEFMQLRNTQLDEKEPKWSEEAVAYYMKKTYLKSASLISKSCRAAALLGYSSPEVVDAAYSYGRNLGLAFQLIDDMLDYTITDAELGKPSGADLQLGLATAPLLFAWKQMPELGRLVGRKFVEPGDVELVSQLWDDIENLHPLTRRQAREMVLRSDGLEQTRALAQEHANQAISAIESFPASEAKDGLIEMCVKTTTRRR